MSAFPWPDFVSDTVAERAAKSRAYERSWKEREREDELRAEQIDRQRKEQLLKFFYGAAAEVSIREFPGFKPFANVETEAGSKITVQADRIVLEKPDQDSTVATILLLGAMWGGARSGGRRSSK